MKRLIKQRIMMGLLLLCCLMQSGCLILAGLAAAASAFRLDGSGEVTATGYDDLPFNLVTHDALGPDANLLYGVFEARE